MGTHDLAKALEIWTLQNLVDLSIFFGMSAFVLALLQDYLDSLKGLLSLRVSVEVWEVFTRVMVDVALFFAVAFGFFVLNPDIMADIKIAVPFEPLATVLFAAAFVMRVFRGGHAPGSRWNRRAVKMMLAAVGLNLIGYTLIMEAPSAEYLNAHPSPFWSFLKHHLRSNADLDLSQIVFLVCFPLLLGIFGWGTYLGLARIRARESDS